MRESIIMDRSEQQTGAHSTEALLFRYNLDALLHDLLHRLLVKHEVAPQDRPQPSDHDGRQKELEETNEIGSTLRVSHAGTDQSSNAYAITKTLIACLEE